MHGPWTVIDWTKNTNKELQNHLPRFTVVPLADIEEEGKAMGTERIFIYRRFAQTCADNMNLGKDTDYE